MRKIIQFFIFSFITYFAHGQANIREITCLGEVVKNIKTDKIISMSRDTGTIFKINDEEKSINVKTATRYEVFQDKFYYEDIAESPYAKIYSCYREGDRNKTKYFISILSDKVTLMMNSQVVESKIISDRIFD